MTSRAIEYIWKVARPKNEAIARALMFAAYETAIKTDPNTTQVLICSYIRGAYVKGQAHITISVKNPETAKAGQHQSSYGYTPELRTLAVVRVSPSTEIKNDNIGGAWPATMAERPKEVYDGQPALLGPRSEFITWPSEEAGERSPVHF